MRRVGAPTILAPARRGVRRAVVGDDELRIHGSTMSR